MAGCLRAAETAISCCCLLSFSASRFHFWSRAGSFESNHFFHVMSVAGQKQSASWEEKQTARWEQKQAGSLGAKADGSLGAKAHGSSGAIADGSRGSKRRRLRGCKRQTAPGGANAEGSEGAKGRGLRGRKSRRHLRSKSCPLRQSPRAALSVGGKSGIPCRARKDRCSFISPAEAIENWPDP